MLDSKKFADHVISQGEEVKLDPDPARDGSERLVAIEQALIHNFTQLQMETLAARGLELEGESLILMQTAIREAITTLIDRQKPPHRIVSGMLALDKEKSAQLSLAELCKNGSEVLYELEAKYPLIRIQHHPLTFENSEKIPFKRAWATLDTASNSSTLSPHTDLVPVDLSTTHGLPFDKLREDYGKFLVLHQPQQPPRRGKTYTITPELFIPLLYQEVDQLIGSGIHTEIDDLYLRSLLSLLEGISSTEIKYDPRTIIQNLGFAIYRQFKEGKIDYVKINFLQTILERAKELAHRLTSKIIERALEETDKFTPNHSGVYVQNWARHDMQDCTLLISHRLLHGRLAGTKEEGILWRNYL